MNTKAGNLHGLDRRRSLGMGFPHYNALAAKADEENLRSEPATRGDGTGDNEDQDVYAGAHPPGSASRGPRGDPTSAPQL